MNIGFSSNAFTNYSLINSIEIISKIGYDGIEIVLDEPHAFLPLQKNEITKIKESLSKNNLLVSNLNANTVLGWKNNFNGEKFEPSLSNPNQKLRSWRIDYTKQAIDLAHILNSKSICITSGLNTMENSNQCFQLFQDSLIDLCEYAEKKNVLIAIEYEPYLLVDNSEKVLKLLSNDFKNIGLNFDTCHAEVTKENLSKIISSFEKNIFHTHISDCKNNVHFHLIPGLGDIDFKEMYDSLKKIGYDEYLTAELYPYSDNPEDAASKAFIYLKNLMN
jgi:fructoselysine 3-epimerase